MAMCAITLDAAWYPGTSGRLTFEDGFEGTRRQLAGCVLKRDSALGYACEGTPVHSRCILRLPLANGPSLPSYPPGTRLARALEPLPRSAPSLTGLGSSLARLRKSGPGIHSKFVRFWCVCKAASRWHGRSHTSDGAPGSLSVATSS